MGWKNLGAEIAEEFGEYSDTWGSVVEGLEHRRREKQADRREFLKLSRKFENAKRRKTSRQKWEPSASEQAILLNPAYGLEELVRLLKKPRATVQRHRKALGGSAKPLCSRNRPGRRPKYTDERSQMILLDRQLSGPVAAEMLGVSKWAVNRWRHRNGVSLPVGKYERKATK